MNLEKSIKFTEQVTKAHLKEFYDTFPPETSHNLVYVGKENISWTSGFYEGILWLLYELTGDKDFYNSAKHHSKSFRERLDKGIDLEHHDIGFLYTLSCVADYKLTGDEKQKRTALDAADILMKRYHPEAGFIQAWGEMNDPGSYRFIIDCLMNIPLLFWANEVTDEQRYFDVAYRHMKTTVDNIIRDDYSTYHTFFFDYKTHRPLEGKTAQGYSDDSCWSRGQSWAVYGIALAYHYTKEESLIEIFNNVTEYFIKYLPADSIPYWDLCFGDGSGEPRDTSAAAIAACGIFEMNKYVKNEKFMKVAEKIMESLSENYTTEKHPESNGFLTDGMYSRKYGDEPECTSWGDYFYLEALMRMKNPDWKMYW
ncbi:MAG: glycoside hydrolase family 88 protein [Firmicutes bacterium]|nr:glycoside hydrolase family 88 protein [Bacillota bacterium]